MSALPRSYRTLEEFEREEIRPSFRIDPGFCSLPAERAGLFFGQILLGDRGSAPYWKVD